MKFFAFLRKHTVLLFFFCCVVMLTFVGMYYTSAKHLERQWDAVNSPRSMDEAWGVIDALARCLDPDTRECRSVMPNFIPPSLWDNEACAALVRNTLNYALGADVFLNAPAWTFAEVNQNRMTLVYNREHDFRKNVGNKSIVEHTDSGFQLSRLLSRNHLYVLGYHYQFTRSDPKIIDADMFWNSHIMLLLPQQHDGWWGFHLIHEGLGSPFRIERIDYMPEKFDLMYIWRIDTINRPASPAHVRFVHYTMAYEQAVPWLRFGRWFGVRINSYIDTIMMYFAHLYYDALPYPSVVIEQAGKSSFIRHQYKNVLGHAYVRHGDTLTSLVQKVSGATIQATMHCNPELHSKHYVYTSQVLRICE